ncbi:MAG: antirestriction protein ArdA [Cohaesibacter sp.]|nr:antirestriction protein ArdA [Cohaesibacter sp.]
MTITLHAQPYDLSANGFYFSSAEEYADKVRNVKNAYGDVVEEFEIQFIDGEELDCTFAKAIGISQANVARFLELVEDLEDWKKINLIIAVGEIGYDFDPCNESDHDDIELYRVDNMRELAEQFVEEGLFGDIPERLQFYIDYDAIARDLAFDYSEIEIAGERLIYRAC